MTKSTLLMTAKYSNIPSLTTSLARRTLLLISFLLLGLGNVWGQVTINESATARQTILLYEKNNNLREYYLSTSDYIDKIKDAIPELSTDNMYVRWGLKNEAGKKNLNDGWDEYRIGFEANNSEKDNSNYYFTTDGYFIYYNRAWGGVSFSNLIDDILNTKIYIYNEWSSQILNDYTIECYISKGISDGNEPDEFDLKVEIIFNDKGKADDAFNNDDNSKASFEKLFETVTLKSPTYDTTNNAVTLSKPDNWPNENVRYVRWYIANADGELLDAVGESSEWIESPGDGFATDSEGSHGWYWHSETAQSTSALQIPKVTLPVGKNFETYRLVAVMSTDEGTLDGDTFKEPVYTLMYYFNFEFPFKPETIEETVAKKLPIGPKDWEQSLKVAFDYTAKKIKLLNQYGVELSAVDIEESLWNEVNTNNPNPFYVRWFLQDATTGEEQYIEDALSNSNCEIPEKPRYGLYWSSSRNSVSNLSDIMQMSVDYTKVDLSRYNLVCTIATDLDGIEPANGNGALSHEPNTMALKYVFKFIDSDWAGTENPQRTHTREVFVNKTTAAAGKVMIPLSESYTRILTEYGMMGKELGESFHMRWYVTYKDEPIYSQTLFTKKQGYNDIGKLGIYWNSKTANSNPLQNEPFDGADEVKNMFDVDFTKPTEGDWSDYKVVVVMSNDLTTQSPTYTTNELTHEPTELNMKYVFRFYTEGDFQFVHYKGEANRPYVTSATDTRIKSNGIQQYSWDRELGEPVKVDEAIRQGVHTVELEVYIDSNEEPYALPVPLQDYLGNGNNLEPAAYFRWYDWTTDLSSDKLSKAGTHIESKKDIQGNDFGWFMLNISAKGNNNLSVDHEKMGVTYDPSALTNEKSVDYIACDVSKYYDGIYEGSETDFRPWPFSKAPVMLHEPTISTRYIFTIRPASVIMDKIMGDVSAERGAAYFQQIIKDLKNGTSYTTIKNKMFNLCEDRGRVIVSDGRKFSVRTGLPTIGDYYISGTTKCTKITWYAYYENSEGLWYNSTPLSANSVSSDGRITVFTMNNLEGDYTLLTTPQKTRTENFTFSSLTPTIHIIGCVGNETTMAEAIHYEMQFINQPAIIATELDNEIKTRKKEAEDAKKEYDNAPDNMKSDKAKTYNEKLEAYTNIAKRSKTYLEENFNSEGVVDFNNYFDNGDEPTNQFQNMTFMPFEWNEAQYSFCYPNIDRFRITTAYSGFTPIHGDYMVLKSLNKDKVSNSSSTPYSYYPYDTDDELHDYTKTMGGDWGGFVYVDASDETRTITILDFDADLCRGSHIYFTAAIANMTGGSGWIPPQIMAKVYGVKADGDVLVISFLTGVLDESHQNKGKWYQVYGEGTIPEYTDMDGITSYKVEIVNFSHGTDGADYCVDDICFYTSTAKVLLTHAGSSNCDDGEESGETVLAYMEAEGLQNAFGVLDGPQPIYWRICEEGSKVPIIGVGMYPQYKLVDGRIEWDNDDKDEVKRNTYGITYVVSDYNTEGVVVTEYPNTPETYGWYKDENGKYFFQIANKTFDALEKGKHYYVSVYIPGADIKESYNESYWGSADDPCSIYSEFFIPRRQYVTYLVPESDGKEGGDITIPCGSSGAEVSGVVMVLKVPDETEVTGFRDEYINFDYILCSKSDWDKDENLEGSDEYTYSNLNNALLDYRTNTTYKEVKGLQESYNTENASYYAVLKYAVDNGILLLDNSSTFTHTFNEVGTHYVICVPTVQSVDKTEICGPFEVIFKLKSSGGPSLILGFDDVDYSKVSGYRVVRVGLEQIRNMQNNDYLLHIPVNTFKVDVNGEEKVGTLAIVSDYLELLPIGVNQTTDSKVDQKVQVATFDGDKEINSNKMYISVNFHGEDIDEQTFYEGFTYHMFFQVKNKDAGDGACEAPVNFLLKVVPEYVTWEGKSKQWNNDANWSRSTSDELYKESGYDNTQGITPTPSTYPAFVPMKFTYVTMPTGKTAPELVNLTMSTTTKDKGIYTYIGDGATKDIEYDLMVRYTEETCIDHGVTPNTKIYDCEKFYGNWAKEIYFKPEAELVNQHYLTYEKVWVEKELEANTWTLMSTPLQNTYAGDMYVPVGGRQKTEAFQPINFTTPDYSRTLYPIYQRSWGMEQGKVYTKKEDVRGEYYSALLKFPTKTVETTFAEWSHTYNDVQVPYSTWTGFAIRAHKKGTGTALLRLPKIDKKYSYYQWDGKIPQETAQTREDLDKGKYGKLFTDDENPDYIISNDSVTYGVAYTTAVKESDVYKIQTPTTISNATVEVPVGELQNVDDYLLVGNPYLCSIDMSKFLANEDNKNILDVNKYWTYEDNEVQNPLPTEIKPLQSFFVKLNSTPSSTPSEDAVITFTSAMMTDGNNQPAPNPAPSMTMTAANERGQSTATVSLGEETKSVETLFDSNLEEVPMVYTVADGRAVSLQQLTDLDKPIAFGVTCAASDELVEVTFTDVAQLTNGNVCVVDAVTGAQTTVGEGSVVAIQPNDYGRYFLLAGMTTIVDRVDVQKGIIISVRDREVTVTSGEELTQVHALSLTGATVYQDAARSTTASFSLSSGVYIIKAENKAGEQQTVKVIVK